MSTSRDRSRAGIQAGGLLAVLVLVIPGMLFAEEGGSWTNRVGHVLKATPQTIQGQSVKFLQNRTGKTVNYPLSAFLPAEQERLRCCLKDTTLPVGLKAAHDFSWRIIARSRLLKKNGSLSEQGYQKAVKSSRAAFRAQAAPFVAKKKLSQERLELLVRELGTSVNNR